MTDGWIEYVAVGAACCAAVASLIGVIRIGKMETLASKQMDVARQTETNTNSMSERMEVMAREAGGAEERDKAAAAKVKRAKIRRLAKPK